MQPSSVSSQPITRASGTATPSAVATLLRGGDLELAGAGPEAAGPGQDRRAGELAAAGDDEQPAALLLVAVFGMIGERETAEQSAVERFGTAHRAATMASGSEVTGAASSTSGAAKL
jgi:hypothetical protein